MELLEAFALISGWPDLPPYDEGIGVGGAFRDAAYALMSELLPDCRDEGDLRMAVAKGKWDVQVGGSEGNSHYWRCHRAVHSAVRKRDGVETHENLLMQAH